MWLKVHKEKNAVRNNPSVESMGCKMVNKEIRVGTIVGEEAKALFLMALGYNQSCALGSSFWYSTRGGTRKGSIVQKEQAGIHCSGPEKWWRPGWIRVMWMDRRNAGDIVPEESEAVVFPNSSCPWWCFPSTVVKWSGGRETKANYFQFDLIPGSAYLHFKSLPTCVYWSTINI